MPSYSSDKNARSPDINLSELYDLYAAAFYGQIMKCCDHRKDIAERMLSITFQMAHEDILNFNRDFESPFFWLFRILVTVLRDNGFTPVLSFRPPEKQSESVTTT